MKGVFKDLERLVALNTANMDEEKKLTAINVLKEMFSFAQTSIVLSARNAVQAVLFGINCDLKNFNGGLVLSGHIDTVPIRNDYCMDKNCFYGRGTADMKGFFPCIKKALSSIGVKNMTLPIMIAITFDEETGNGGISAIRDFFVVNNISLKYCIVGEPTSSACALVSYGCYDFIIKIKGVECHISNQETQNVVTDTLICLNFLDSIKKDYGRTVIKTTFINGGDTLNVSSSEYTVGYQIRTMDTTKLTKINNDIENFLTKNGIVYFIQNNNTDLIPFENINSKFAKKLLINNGNRSMDFFATTEAGYYQLLGADTVICGPGDCRLAHTVNEFIFYK